jgi:hypothetical protein
MSSGLSRDRARLAARRGGTVRLAIALLVTGLVAVTGSQIAFSGAGFTAHTENPGNTFEAAASFGGLRVVSGLYVGTGVDNRAITGVGFDPDLVIVKGNTGQSAVTRTATMSGDNSKPMVGSAALGANMIQSLDTGGFTVGTDARVNSNNVIYHWTAIKSDPGALKLGSYTGDGSSGRAINGVGFSPEYVAILPASNALPIQRASGMTASFEFGAHAGSSTDRINSLDGDGFTVGNNSQVNGIGTNYHYLAFKSVAGSVKKASFTGSNSPADNRSISGVGFQPAYLLIRANDTGTARRAVHRSAALDGDSTLHFDNLVNEANNIQALQSDGFEVGSDGDVNANGQTIHYLALKDAESGCASPGSQTVPSSADTWVDQANPTANFGNSSDLFVQSKSGNANRRTLVKYQLPALPSGCSVTGAALRLNATTSTASRTIQVFRAAAAWTEGNGGSGSGVTWTTQPATEGTASSHATNGTTEFKAFDVTAHVKNMYDEGNDGFILRDSSEDSGSSPEQKYQSKEGQNSGSNTDSGDPKLVVSWG